MLRLHQIFLYHFLFIFSVAFILTGIISYFFLKGIEVEQSTHQLKNNIMLIKPQLSSRKFDEIAEDIKENTDLRLTIISNSGLVLAESHREADEMNNHARRVEIKKAKKSDFGVSIRHSQSLGIDFLYVAKVEHLYNGSVYLRLALPLTRVLENFYAIWVKLTLMFAIMVAIGFMVALRMSRRIEDDVKHLTNYLEDVSNKTYNSPLRLHVSYEFINIGNTLKAVVAKLARRERQRRRSTAKLKLMYKQQNDLLSAISHEFKNPLAAISGYAQTLMDEELHERNHKIYHKFLTKIENNSQKISSMLDRIALSVKLENNDLVPHKDSFDLSEVVQDAVAVIEKKYPGRKIHFKTKHHMVTMDKTMIEMVIINLLDNGMKYSSKDLDLKIGKKRLSITDYGIGIAQEELAKVQSKFYRVDKNSWDNSMGLGLAIVNYILNLHDTKLDIESELDKGTTFSFVYAQNRVEEGDKAIKA